MSDRLTIERTHQPTIELTRLAQTIGLAAWQQRMPWRGEAVRHTFNPDDPAKADRLLARMKEKSGRFVGAVALIGEQPVGYSLAHDDVSGNSIERLFKQSAVSFENCSLNMSLLSNQGY
jgi:hypothetical protein